MADPTFEEIAAALYSGQPDAFVASRKARAEEAGALAPRIRALKKPSIAAWVVNVFAQERSGQLGEALQLARELREAQDDLDAPALAKLGRDRRALTRRLAATAAELAASRGERITPATLESVEQSISAAFFDPTAASAVASGRLVRALTPSSSEEEIRDAVAGELDEGDAAPPPQPPDELQARRKRREAERRVAAAEKEQAVAERELGRKDSALEKLRSTADELSERVADLEAQLERARAEVRRVEQELPELEAAQAEAAKRVEETGDAVERARTDLASL